MSSYVLHRFVVGTTSVTLPIYDTETPLDGAPAQSGAVQVIGGMYDTVGDQVAQRSLPYTMAWVGVAIEDSEVLLSAALRTLRGLVGRRGRLYRILADGSHQWCVARVLHAPPPLSRPTRLVSLQPMEIVFEVYSAWYGAHLTGDGWLLDDGEYLDDGLYLDTGTETILSTSPKTITLTHDGDAEITTIIITVTAGSADITALTVKAGSTWEWTYTGTITAGQALVVDCGAHTIKNNGAADFAHWDLTANHNQNHWFALQPGSNTVTVTLAGGSTDSTIAFEYDEAYE